MRSCFHRGNRPPARQHSAQKLCNVTDDRSAAGSTAREREIERGSNARTGDCAKPVHRALSPAPAHRTSGAVPQLFDIGLRAIRRDRAARVGPELFLFERVFDDCLERLSLIGRTFERALLIGCPDSRWPERLQPFSSLIEVRDPSPLFAHAAGGHSIVEDAWEPPEQAYDLVLTIGTLDTVNDLPLALRSIRVSMRKNAVLLGAMSGGDTLPQLRIAMRAADALAGGAAAHVHPRIEASALSPLLDAAGLVAPVIDVERVQVSYRSFDRLVGDLRAMGATNILTARSVPMKRTQRDAAARSFAEAAVEGRTTEVFEFLHFAARTPQG